MDRALDEIEPGSDPFLEAAAREALSEADW